MSEKAMLAAFEAAEALAAEGLAVTARAVASRANVRMAVANEVARDWKARVAEQQGAPEVPEQVQLRFEGVWAEAFKIARDEFHQARVGWESDLKLAAEEASQLAADVDAAVKESERLVAELEAAKAAHATALTELREQFAQEAQERAQALAAERSRADRAEGALAAVTSERDRLAADLKAALEGLATRTGKTAS